MSPLSLISPPPIPCTFTCTASHTLFLCLPLLCSYFGEGHRVAIRKARGRSARAASGGAMRMLMARRARRHAVILCRVVNLTLHSGNGEAYCRVVMSVKPNAGYFAPVLPPENLVHHVSDTMVMRWQGGRDCHANPCCCLVFLLGCA